MKDFETGNMNSLPVESNLTATDRKKNLRSMIAISWSRQLITKEKRGHSFRHLTQDKQFYETYIHIQAP